MYVETNPEYCKVKLVFIGVKYEPKTLILYDVNFVANQ